MPLTGLTLREDKITITKLQISHETFKKEKKTSERASAGNVVMVWWTFFGERKKWGNEPDLIGIRMHYMSDCGP